MTTNPTQTDTVDAPGRNHHYDVRGDLGDATPDRPALLMVSSPMDASGFGTLATRFIDRPVVTFDLRGVSRTNRAGPNRSTGTAGGTTVRVQRDAW